MLGYLQKLFRSQTGNSGDSVLDHTAANGLGADHIPTTHAGSLPRPAHCSTDEDSRVRRPSAPAQNLAGHSSEIRQDA